MNTVESIPPLLTVLGLLTGPVVTGAFTLAGVRVAERSNRRRQLQVEQAQAQQQIETVTTELIDATFVLLTGLAARQPRWNSWQPRLMLLGRSLLEFQSGRHTKGYAHGVAHAGRLAFDWHEQMLASTELFTDTVFRQFTAACSRAVLLPDKDVVDAVAKLVEAAFGVVTAYGADNLYRRKAATTERAAAEAVLQEALGALTLAARTRLHPPTPPASVPWWRPARWWPPARRRRSAELAVSGERP
ncbi:hypothetical protein [Micromonospora sp. NPDC092111]|uniref:hypothetical protein n=1 Tax=Micromonospora sp. NPDC092111 TaxID=3364289 RepID=UPI003815397D